MPGPSGVYNIIVQQNVVYNVYGQEGDCLKFAYGVYSSQMLDNVMWNCPRGSSSQTENYGIAVYGGPVAAASASTVNIVARNMVVGTYVAGHQNIGIYAAVGTYIINNLVIESSFGIAVRSEGTNNWVHTQVIHNTVWNTNLYGFSVRDSSSADSTVIIANNVFSVGANYQNTAVGYCWYQMTTNGIIVENNAADGQSNCDNPPVQAFNNDTGPFFTNPGVPTSSPGPDFTPIGGLLSAGAATSVTGVTNDFDTNSRNANQPDIGCYEANSGTHWAIILGMKGSSTSPITDGGDGGDGNPASALAPSPIFSLLSRLLM